MCATFTVVEDEMSNPVSFRFDDETAKLLERLCATLGVGRVQVLRLALRVLARRENVKMEDVK